MMSYRQYGNNDKNIYCNVPHSTMMLHKRLNHNGYGRFVLSLGINFYMGIASEWDRYKTPVRCDSGFKLINLKKNEKEYFMFINVGNHVHIRVLRGWPSG